MVAKADRKGKGVVVSKDGPQRPRNIYDRIAAARAEREAAQPGQPRDAADPVNAEPPRFPLDREATPKPLKTSPVPANTPRKPPFPELTEIPPDAPDDQASARRWGGLLLWTVSAVIAALVMAAIIVGARPAAREPVPAAPASLAANPPATTEARATATDEVLGQFALDDAIVSPTETIPVTLPLPQPTAPEIARAVPRPALSAAPLSEAAPTVQPDQSVTTAPAFDPESYRIVVQVPRGVPSDTRDTIIGALESAGLEAEPRTVNLSISRSNIRYYHAEDAKLAGYIAQSLGAELRDFTSFRPTPRAGLIEIWLEGRRGGSQQAASERSNRFAEDLRRLRQDLIDSFRR